MNLYSLLPLVAFLANVILGLYVLYRAPRENLNRLYSLFAFALAIWALGDFFVFTASGIKSAIYWTRLGSIGPHLMPSFLLHFFLVFTGKKFISKKMFYMPLYLPALFFIIVNFTTDLLIETLVVSAWGYAPVPGSLYNLLTFYAIAYVITGFLVCYRFYSKAPPEREKIQAKLLLIALAVPIACGIALQVIPPIIGLQTVQLTAALTTVTAIIIAYAIIKYRLMATVSLTSMGMKLTAFFLVISLIPLFAVGFFSLERSSNAIIEETCNHLTSVVILKENQINNLIQEEMDDLERVALYISYREYNATGAPSDSFPLEVFSDMLELMLEKQKGFIEFYILDLNGTIRVSTDRENEGKSRAFRPYFIEGQNRTYVKGVHYAMSSWEPTMVISTPLKMDGRLVGVLAGRVNLNYVNKLMAERSGLGESGETYLVNNYNYFVTESRFEEGYALKKTVFSDGVEKCLGGVSGTGIYGGYMGYPVIGAYRWAPEHNLCVLAEVSTEEALRTRDATRDIIMLFSLGIALLIVLIGMLFSSTFTGPIIRLMKGAKKIGKGDLDFRIKLKSRDEIGQLARAFNIMAADLKKSREKLEGYNKTLERRVKQRTGQLGQKVSDLKKAKSATLNIMEDLSEVNRELEDKRKELEKANRELKKLDLLKSEFMNIAAHELKTPLIPIVGYLDMMRESPKLGSREKEEIDICLRNASRLQRLVQDVLDISKLESKAMKFDMKRVDVAGLVKDTMIDMKEFAEKMRVKLRCELPGRPLWVCGDEQRLIQVMTNLVNNAIKFTDRGSVTMRAGLDGKDVLISVEDTGMGVSRKDLPRLFDKFFQADSSVRRKYGGTGLGLAICKSIVEAHGGEIRVKSKPGKGSTFAFSLPFKQGT